MKNGKGRRYDGEPKLNIKKVIAVIVAFAVIIMFIIGIKTLLTKDKDEIKTTVTSYYPVYTNEKWGVIDQTGKIIIQPEFTEMITIPDSKTDIFICVYDVDYQNNTYKTKVYNSKNKEQFTQYDLVETIENRDKNNRIWQEAGILKVKKDGKYGLIDYTGKCILEPQYDKIYALQEVQNSILLEKDGKIGLCDNKGSIIINPEYKEIKAVGNDYKNGYIVVNQDNQYGMIDFTKTTILETKYEEIKPTTSNDQYIVKENSNLKVINKQGETILENKFEDAKEINGDFILFIKNKKLGMMNKAGEIKIPAEYDDLQFAGNEYYIAKKAQKYGVINATGETKIPFEYVNITYQKEAGFLTAQKSDTKQTEILDNSLTKKIEGTLLQIDKEKGYLQMKIGEDIQYYNFKFETKTPQEIFPNNTLYLSKKDGKYGYIDKEGNIVVDHIYEDATEQNSYGYAAVKKDGKWGSIDQNGNQIVNNQYDLENNAVIDFIDKWHLGKDINSYYYTDQ